MGRGDLRALRIGEPAVRGELDRPAPGIAGDRGRRRRAQVGVAPERAGRERGIGLGERAPSPGGLGGAVLGVELGGEGELRRERLERAAGQGADQLGALVEQLEPPVVGELGRGVERDVEAAQPAERVAIAAGKPGERRLAQLERAVRIAAAIEDERGGRGDLVGRRAMGEPAGAELDDARPVPRGGVHQGGELGHVRSPGRWELAGEQAIREVTGAAGLAVAPQPRLGDLDAERAGRTAGDSLEQRGVVLGRHQAQARRQRVRFGQLEQAERLVGLLERVPARERGPHVQVREPFSGIVAAEQRRRLARDELDHVRDQLRRIGHLQHAAGIFVPLVRGAHERDDIGVSGEDRGGRMGRYRRRLNWLPLDRRRIRHAEGEPTVVPQNVPATGIFSMLT